MTSDIVNKQTLIDVHLRRSLGLRMLLLLLLLPRSRVRRLRPTVRCLRPWPIRRLHLGRLGLGLGQDRNGEINQLLPLLNDIRHLQHRILVLGPLGLPRDLVLEPLLDRRAFLDDGRLVLLINVRVLVVRGGRLRKVIVERRPEFSDDARAFFVLGPARDDGVADDFKRVEAGDVGGLGRVLAFLRVQPVFGLLE